MNKLNFSLFLYGGALLSLLAVDYLFGVLPWNRSVELGSDSAVVKERIEELKDIIDGTGAPDITQTRSKGFINNVSIHPGFAVVHDASLGSEIRLTGPAQVLDHVKLGGPLSENLALQFDRFVRLAKPVEVRLNLNRHGSGKLNLSSWSGTENLIDASLVPSFRTEGPLEHRLLDLSNITILDQAELAAGTVAVRSNQTLSGLSGTVERMEINYVADSIPAVTLPANLRVGEMRRFGAR